MNLLLIRIIMCRKRGATNFHTLPTPEKWELVEIALRQLGLLEDDQ